MQPLQRHVHAAAEQHLLELGAHDVGAERARRLRLRTGARRHVVGGHALVERALARYFEDPSRVATFDDVLHADVNLPRNGSLIYCGIDVPVKVILR